MLEYLVLSCYVHMITDDGISKVVIQYTWLGVVCADVGISSSKVVIL